MKAKKECWFCLGKINNKNYIEQNIYHKGEKTSTIYYCNKQCLIDAVLELEEDNKDE
jgi:hypothetical protein